MRRTIGTLVAAGSAAASLLLGSTTAIAAPPGPAANPGLQVLGDSFELTQTYGIPAGEHTMHGYAVVVPVVITCPAGADAHIELQAAAYSRVPGTGGYNHPYQQGFLFLFAPEHFQCTGSPQSYEIVAPSDQDPAHGYAVRTYFQANLFMAVWSDGAQSCNGSSNCTQSSAGKTGKIVDAIPG